jgi:hypothetical protein
MKVKLILKRYNDCYALNDYREPSKGYPLVIAHSGDEHFRYKLSKQNCDEIFGVVDVEKLADEYANVNGDYDEHYGHIGFKSGFNKAMELNKDKVFTLEVVHAAFGQGWERSKAEKNGAEFYSERTRFLKYIQQPTEIEVEMEMQCLDPTCDGINRKGICIPGDKPKLDPEGCLILKRVV